MVHQKKEQRKLLFFAAKAPGQMPGGEADWTNGDFGSGKGRAQLP